MKEKIKKNNLSVVETRIDKREEIVKLRKERKKIHIESKGRDVC